jgi:hypothetical protein
MANNNSPVFIVGITGSRDRPEIFYGKSGPIRHAAARSSSGGEKWFRHMAGPVGNLVLQVTLYTSLKLRGQTTELPRSDFNRIVIRFTRHTLRIHLLMIKIITDY